VNPKNFFAELKRRNVYKVAIAYAVVAWLLMQIATQVFPFLEIPNWAIRLVIMLIVIGFPIALVIAWAFELTPEGLKRTESADELPKKSARSRAWIYVVIVAGAISVDVFFLGRYTSLKQSAESPAKSIAVLPFENLSHDPDNAYFADGIQEEILARLAKIADLKVISRTSTQHYKSSPDNLPQIAKRLGVANILEGSVQKSADKVRVNVELIRASTDAHLWANTFDRKLTDVFAVESEVATKIAETLQAKLTGFEQHAIAARPTENSEAYQLYLKGRYFRNKLTPEGVQKAIEYFQQAIDKDPAYALAYAGLADGYGNLGFWGVFPPREMWPKAKAAALKALEIDDNLVEAHVALGWVSSTYDWDWPAADKHFERAIALNPASRATYYPWYSLYLGGRGRADEAVAEAKRALDLDPVSPVMNFNLAEQLYYARRFDEAIEQCRKTLEMDPSFSPTHSQLARLYVAKGMYREALAESEKYLALTPRNPGALASRAYVHARLNERSQALQALDELTALSKQRYVPSYLFALVYAGLGEKDQTFAWLEKAYQERSGWLPYLKVNPTWDPLRSDPRFEALVAKVFSAQKSATQSP